MKTKLLVAFVATVISATISVVLSICFNYGFEKRENLHNILVCALVIIPVITLFVGKNAYDFYQEELAPRRMGRSRFVAKSR